MGLFILRRLAVLLPTLLGAMTLVFLLIHLIPGDPVQVMLGDNASPEATERLRAHLGLDRPLWEQYLGFLRRYAALDLGTSIRSNRSVAAELAVRFPFTADLAVAGVTVAVLVGVPLGVLSAVRRNTWVDYLCSTVSMAGVAAPNFWLGLVLLIVFSVNLGWFPVIGAGSRSDVFSLLRHLALPALAIGTAVAGLVTRLTRSSVLEVLALDYVRTARAKGLAEGVVIWKHVLRNAAVPLVTVVGLNMGALLGGAIIIETVFARPGLGKMLIDAIYARDYPVIQAATFVIALSFLLINAMVDLLYAVIDPRIRY